MADSTENNKNLDSYGVWVKRPPQDAKTETTDDLDMSDLDSMFAEPSATEEPVVADDATFDTLSDNDTTLSDEELSNIANDINLPEKDATIVTDDDMFADLPDFGNGEPSVAEASIDTPETTESSGEEEFSIDSFMTDSDAGETASEDITTGEDGEISLDDFIDGGFTDPNPGAENSAPSASAETSASEDGEISLDDFMDGGFTDPNPGAAPSFDASASDEISLDDFFDDDSSKEKEDDVSNDEALDIDLSFTESSDNEIETEDADNSSNDEFESDSEFNDMFDNMTSETPAESSAQPAADTDFSTEEVSLEDFGLDENSDDATAVAAGAAVNASADSEEVDLSDFGIDSDAGETPVKQDVQSAKKKQVVDYDLAITEEDTISQAPTAETVPDILSEGTSELEEDNFEETPAVNPNATMVDNSILDQIMAELSGLKNEINSLKDEFEDLKTKEPVVVAAPAPVSVEIPVEQPEIPVEETSEESTGFFDSDDGDDTIALSGDELSNIMNTADFTESTETPSEEADFDIPEENEEIEISETLPEDIAAQIESENTEEPVLDDPVSEEIAETEDNAEFSIDESIDEEVISDDPAFTEEAAFSEEQPASDEPAFADEAAFSEEQPASDEPAFADEVVFSEEQPVSDEPAFADEAVFSEEPDSGLSMNTEETLVEPDFGELDNNTADDITIPSVDDIAAMNENEAAESILVESSNTDLMNSVNDTTEQMAEMTSELSDTEVPEEISLTDASEPLPTVDEIAEEPAAVSEETFDMPSEDILEETVIEETVIEETPVEATPVEDNSYFDGAETDEEDVASISDESIDYLKDEPVVDSIEEPAAEEVVISTPEEPVAEEEAPSTEKDSSLPDDLKSDVKSVLLYMDQLLENLPEDKIMEFAKSEQFSTYKKLFSELGLS